MTGEDVKEVIEHMDAQHLEVMTIKADVAELDAKLDTKADAVDIDGFATTLGLDEVVEALKEIGQCSL